MSIQRLLILMGITLWAFASQARAQVEIELDSKPVSVKINGTPFCPCITPTVTSSASNGSSAQTPAKAQAVPATVPVSRGPARSSTAAKGSEEEITLSEDDQTSAPATPAKAAKGKVLNSEGPTADKTPVSANTPVPKAQAVLTGTSQADSASSPREGKPTPAAALLPKEKVQHAKKAPRENSYEANQWGVLNKVLFRTTFGGTYSHAVLTDANTSNFGSGFGGDFRIEAQLYKSFAMGLYFDPTLFPNPGKRVLVGPLGLFGRFILSHQGLTEFYGMAGGGINSMVGSNGQPPYPKDFHLFGGFGVIQSFGDNWGLDLSAVYNYYTPNEEPLSAISGRVGLTYQINWEDF